MNLKENLAQKMLEEKLDFLPLEDSLELYNSGIRLKTTFWWVIGIEELGTDEKEPYEMTDEELLESYKEVFGDSDYKLRVGKEHEEFDEFTYNLCPAPTYIDLIK